MLIYSSSNTRQSAWRRERSTTGNICSCHFS